MAKIVSDGRVHHNPKSLECHAILVLHNNNNWFVHLGPRGLFIGLSLLSDFSHNRFSGGVQSSREEFQKKKCISTLLLSVKAFISVPLLSQSGHHMVFFISVTQRDKPI